MTPESNVIIHVPFKNDSDICGLAFACFKFQALDSDADPIPSIRLPPTLSVKSPFTVKRFKVGTRLP